MSRRGFSLLEVMVSSAMLIAGLTGIISAIGTTTSMHAHQRKVSEAIHVCEGVLEELLIMPASDTDLSQGVHPGTALEFDDDGDRLTTGTGVYHVTWEVTGGPVASPSMKTITVEVAWSESGSTKSFKLSTIRR